MHEIKNLSTSKSPGHDEITAKFLKISAKKVAPAVSDIINLSIKSGEYPEALKIAKVLPIFKKGDPSLASNYRPISVLSCINKIFEKSYLKEFIIFLKNTIYSMNSNMVSVRDTPPHMHW
ncbi:unnamed protein product [Meganyctiphanes norvegica]|uniref:Reverse transcriptase n=1 Tax=Meganyctiphanes norvegica TaxID=48144 RepID=A0AAV2PPU9_MEGNR